MTTTAQSILRAAQRINALISERTDAIDLTPRQLEIILLMADEPNLSGREMTERCSTDRSTLAAVMRTLRHKKLIDRKPNKEDERAYHNYLTKAGLAKVKDCETILTHVNMIVEAAIASTRGDIDTKLLAIAALGK